MPQPVKLSDGLHTFTVTKGPNTGQTTQGVVSNNGTRLVLPGPAMVPLVFDWVEPPGGYKHHFWDMWIVTWGDNTWDAVKVPDQQPPISDTSGTWA